MEQVAVGFFCNEAVETSDCVRFAQVAAKLGAKIGESFYFVSRDDTLRSIEDVLLWDSDGTLEDFIPEDRVLLSLSALGIYCYVYVV